jgi:hypothetical protein
MHLPAELSDPTFSSISGQGISVETLNRECLCLTLDQNALEDQLKKTIDSVEVYALVRERCPNLFASVPVFTSKKYMLAMNAIISAVQKTVALPAYQQRVLAAAPDVAHLDQPAASVFMGYDFHISKDGPKLIEINTNAGGALLNVILAKAQRACCAATEMMLTGSLPLDGVEDSLVQMFLNEYRLVRPGTQMHIVAIVDENPAAQFLYPEFLMFKRLFERHRIDAIIADPQELMLYDGAVSCGDRKIDLVYNRLTDFSFAQARHAILREAYVNRLAVITPHPRAHALYANKRNLALLSDGDALESIGVPAMTAQILLNGIPRTQVVNDSNAEALWADRRNLFFKPAEGFGSKAAYRGEKLTRRVWNEILQADYVAQALVPPSERLVPDENGVTALKLDVRCYVYQTQIQLVAARLYQGQTTNFRTEGGGFAPVFVLDRPRSCAADPAA